jgi:outer membrane receptor protein involved in Fe transport
MKRIFILSIAVFLSVVNIVAQSTLKGRIADDSGEPLFNVNVVIDASKGYASVTDFDGRYSISLPEGKYTISVSYMGYQTINEAVELKVGEVLVKDFKLLVNEKVLKDVEVVSSTRRSISMEKEVVTVESLSLELIENNNITIASDAVDRVTGVTILDGQVSIRGGSGYAYGAGSRVILVVDEIPLLSPERDEVLWDFIPMENVRSFDVVKGASSVQYGSSALNGIVAVNTNWPTKDKETSVTLFGGMYDNPPIENGKWWTYSTRDFRQTPHEMGIQGSHMRKLNDEMDFVISGAMISNQTHIQNQSNHRIRNNIKWRYRPEKNEGLMVSLNSNMLYRNNDQFFIWENGGTGAYKGRSYNDRYLRYSFDPVVKYYFKNNNQISAINRIYYDQRLSTNRGNYYGVKVYNDIQYKRDYNHKSVNLSGDITAGVVNNHDIIKAVVFSDFSKNGDGIFHFNTLGTYAQSTTQYENLTVAFGARFDYIRLDTLRAASKPVFNAGLSYELKRKNYLRFGFGQSFRVPSVAERFVKEAITSLNLGSEVITVYAGPNPDIKPEEGYTFELGYKKIFESPKFRMQIDAAVFYQYFNNMTEFVFSSNHVDPLDGSTYWGFQMQNISKARIFGWETSLSGTKNFKKVDLDFHAGYTYNYAANAEADPSLGNFFNVVKNSFKAFNLYRQNQNVNLAPPEILQSILRYRFRHTVKSDFNITYEKVSFGTNIRYYGYIDAVDEIFAFVIPGIRDYRNSKNQKGDWIFDARINYQFTEVFSAGFIIRNLFNRDYQIRPAKPDAPRNYSLQARIKF